LDVAELLKHLH